MTSRNEGSEQPPSDQEPRQLFVITPPTKEAKPKEPYEIRGDHNGDTADRADQGEVNGAFERSYDRQYDRDRDKSHEEDRRYDRDHDRSYDKDHDRSYDRDNDRRYDRDNDRSYDRYNDRSYDRDYDRHYDRDYDRDYDRNYDRKYDRDYDRRYDRDFDRSYDRESQFSERYYPQDHQPPYYGRGYPPPNQGRYPPNQGHYPQYTQGQSAQYGPRYPVNHRGEQYAMQPYGQRHRPVPETRVIDPITQRYCTVMTTLCGVQVILGLTAVILLGPYFSFESHLLLILIIVSSLISLVASQSHNSSFLIAAVVLLSLSTLANFILMVITSVVADDHFRWRNTNWVHWTRLPFKGVIVTWLLFYIVGMIISGIATALAFLIRRRLKAEAQNMRSGR